jgi:hypothetical protein
MKSQKIYPFLCGILIIASLFLAACQFGSTSGTESEENAIQETTGVEESGQDNATIPTTKTESTAETQAETPTTEIESSMASTENGLLINENVERPALFKINTLAYELPGMDEVEVLNITYAYHGDRPLTMDVYYPPGIADDMQLPAVVFGLGYRMSSQALRNAHFYTSWGRLVAAAGMVGIAYDTEQPDQDLKILMTFIKENAAALRIDPAKIGFHSTSANPPTVMSYLMQEGRNGIQFSVYYYGHSLTPDRKYTEGFGEICLQRGCLMYDLADVTYVDPNIPLFVVRVGKDFVPNINEAWDHFVDYVRGEGATVTLIDYEEGVHGFDTQQKTQESAQIIADTVDFMKENFGMDS